MLVMGKMFGTPLRGDFEHCEVAFFLGKNPWISHGIPHARTTLKAIAADPDRSMVVIDPRVTETAAMADFHLQVRPGRDAWLIAAMAAVLVDEGLVDRGWLADHASGLRTGARRACARCRSREYCEISGVDEALVRAATRRIAAASSVAAFEDLGVQMNRHSTLVSYLEKLVWLLTGNLANPGGQYAMTGIGEHAADEPATSCIPPPPRCRRSSARGSSVGSSRATSSPEEILADHPQPLPGDDRRVGQPGALDRRQPADARGDASARRQRVHRRVHDRDGPAVRLRAAGHDPVREVRGDVLQLRVPEERLPPPPTRWSTRRTGRCPSRRSTPGIVEAARASSTPTSSTDLRAAAERRPRRVRGRVRRGHHRRPAARRRRRRRAVPHARTDAARTAQPPPRRCGRWRCAAPRSTPTASPAPASATVPTPATGCSTRSSTARPVSCSPTTPGRRPGSGIKTDDGLVHVEHPRAARRAGRPRRRDAARRRPALAAAAVGR